MDKLLLVDDHVDLLDGNRSYFAEQGFAVTACGSGEDAVAVAEREAFDCIVLDIMMPGMDGYAVCEAIRRRADTPVVFLSCLDAPDDKIRALMLGGDAYVTKPYDLGELHAQVLACIRRSGQTAPAVREDFAVDLERRFVRLNDRTMTLSKKESTLLGLLLEQPGALAEKETLLLALWPDGSGDESVLQVHASNLRRKLAFAESRLGRIATVYGRGYRLEPAGEEPS